MERLRGDILTCLETTNQPMTIQEIAECSCFVNQKRFHSKVSGSEDVFICTPHLINVSIPFYRDALDKMRSEGIVLNDNTWSLVSKK